MVLTSPLIRENVWLDKPKYDAAERRYYEKLSQSLASGKADISPSNSNESTKAGVSCDNGLIVAVTNNEPLQTTYNTCILKPKDKEENVCKRSNDVPLCKKPSKTSGKSEGKEGSPISEFNSNESSCFLPSKSDKVKKQIENDPSGSACQRTKVSVKTTAKSIPDQSITNNYVTTGTINNQEVNKLKGYFLQSKPLLPEPDSSSLTKATNVNTIPKLSDLDPCPQSKISLDVKRVNRLNKIATFDKQETTDLIIPTNMNDIPVTNENIPPDDEGKKESKKKKKSKKERLRDKKGVTQNTNSWNSLAGEVAKARQHIKNSLQCIDEIAVTSNTVSVEVANRVVALEKENHELITRMDKLEQKIAALEKQLQATAAAAEKASVCPAPKKEPAPKPPAPAKQSNDDDDDGVDLFASDSEEEDTEAAKLKEQRLAEYAAKKSKKPALIAKSSIILDVKPWDDETDMKLLEQEVRKIAADGLLWGASKLVPLAYGIHKLQINCVVEDEKISVDWLQETIQEIEDYVQSVDIAAFNKI